MLRRGARLVLAALLAALAFAGLAAGLRRAYTSRVHGGYDLYIPWAATCGWVKDGRDPYSPQTTLSIQEAVYGRPARPGEIQADFAYPAYAALLTIPFCLTDDFSIVYAVALSAFLVCVVATAVLARRATGWQPASWLWIWSLVWIILLYPTARGLLLGQLAVVVALIQVAALEALHRRQDILAGSALALTTIKPQMALLLVPVVLFWSAWQRRWRVPGAFAVVLGLLVLIPMIWLPNWLISWLEELRQYTGYTEFGSVTWILTTHALGAPAAVEAVVTFALLAWLALEVWRARQAPFDQMLWLAALTLVLTHFVSPRTATTHFGPLLVPLFMIFRVLQRPGERRTALVAALLPAAAVLSWALFLTTVAGIQESAWNYVPIPLALLLALLWLRRPWMRLVKEAS